MIVDAFGQELHKGDLVATAVASGRSSGIQRIGFIIKEPEPGKKISIELITRPKYSWERPSVYFNYEKGKVVKLPESYAGLLD